MVYLPTWIWSSSRIANDTPPKKTHEPWKSGNDIHYAKKQILIKINHGNAPLPINSLKCIECMQYQLIFIYIWLNFVVPVTLGQYSIFMYGAYGSSTNIGYTSWTILENVYTLSSWPLESGEFHIPSWTSIKAGGSLPITNGIITVLQKLVGPHLVGKLQQNSYSPGQYTRIIAKPEKPWTFYFGFSSLTNQSPAFGVVKPQAGSFCHLTLPKTNGGTPKIP